MKEQRISLRSVVCALVGIALVAGCSNTRQAAETRPESNEKSEQIDIGYGTKARDDLTGSVSSLSGEELDQPGAISVAEMLKGRVAGVQVTEGPGGGIQVRIRGTSSFYGSNEPLYVVDGVPIMAGPDGALMSINPHDIESINVLKDAASTAIYGSRGANGVIVIRTKRGN